MSIITQINLLKKRRTKIIATLGPASSEPDQIRKLIKAGVNIFRQNMSHGDHSYHKETYARIRKIAEELNQHWLTFVALKFEPVNSRKVVLN